MAYQMRNQLTASEKCLWEALRKRQLNGLKFRKQHAVGRFILDFYCPEHKLVVEIDGASHETRHEYDAERTEILNVYGYRVLRFTNKEIAQDLPAVLSKIIQACDTPHELPQVERPITKNHILR